MKISRRILRRIIFAVRDQRVETLDRQDKVLAEAVQDIFNGYMLGAIGWLDFSFKWDINPGPVEDDNTWSLRELSLEDWSAEVMNLWEWKEWMRQFEESYGKTRIPPPCFTRQGLVGNGR
jgi:hypothetical protein